MKICSYITSMFTANLPKVIQLISCKGKIQTQPHFIQAKFFQQLDNVPEVWESPITYEAPEVIL